MVEVVLKSILTCPECGDAEAETMPENACVHFYECKQCGVLLQPRRGECCVFCSYGSVLCPPIQAEAAISNEAQGESTP